MLPRSIILWTSSALVLFFLIAPILIIIPMSMSAGQFLQFPPSSYGLHWYAKFFGSPDWLDALLMSGRVSAMSTILSLVLGVLSAFALTRGEFRGKLALYCLLLLPMVVPTIITAIAVYFLFVKLRLVGSAFGMALGTAVTTIPIVVLITSSTLQTFDVRLEQAALSLGASRPRAFLRVTLPLIAPGIISAALFAFLHSFTELLVPLFLAGPTSMTLTVKIWTTIVMQIEPTIAAVSVVLIALAVAVLVCARLAQFAFARGAVRSLPPNEA